MLSKSIYKIKRHEIMLVTVLFFLIFFLPHRIFILYVFFYFFVSFFGVFYFQKKINCAVPYEPVLFLIALFLMYFLSYYSFVGTWEGYIQNWTSPLFFLSYVMCSMAFVYIISKNPFFYFYLCHLVAFFSLMLSVLVIIQMHDIMGLNKYYYELIGGSRGVSYLNNPGYRPLGVYGNPNEVAFVLSLSALMVAGERKIYLKSFCVLYFIFVFYSLYLTGSRTALIALSLSFFPYLYLPRVRLDRICVAILFLFFFVVTYAIGFLPERFYNFGSFIDRVNIVWHDAFLILLDTFPFGVGRASLNSTIDNEYIEIFLRGGLLVFLVYIFFLLSMVLIFSKREKITLVNPAGLSMIIFVATYGVAISIGFTAFNIYMLFSFILFFSRYSYLVGLEKIIRNRVLLK